MVYGKVFLFDLYDSVENGESGEKRVRKLVAEKCLFHQVLYGYASTLTQNKRGHVCVLFRKHSNEH